MEKVLYCNHGQAVLSAIKKKGGEEVRFNLMFELSGNNLPIDYHSIFTSYFKHAFESYNVDLYEKLYGGSEMKPFCTSIYFNKCVFFSDKIKLDSNIFNISISTYDDYFKLDLYNAFSNQINKIYKFKDIEFKLIKIINVPLNNITDDTIIIKMNSPLVVRNHFEDNKDIFYKYDDEDFKKTLLINIQNTIQRLNLDITLEGFDIIPLKPKKTVIKSYGVCITANLGIYELKGNSKLLQFLFQAGIGSRRSSFCGQFNVIG